MRWVYLFAGMALWCLPGCARSAAELGKDTDRVDGPADASTPADAGNGKTDASPSDAGAPPEHDAGGGKDAGQGGGSPAMCRATNLCATARNLPPVAGDTGSDTSMANGTRSEWLQVDVTDTTLTGSSLTAEITLTSQGGANYDLFVLKPNDEGGNSSAPRDCGATPRTSQNPSGIDKVRLSWDDQINNPGERAGDGLILSIEVRHVSGPCGSWNLLVQGSP